MKIQSLFSGMVQCLLLYLGTRYPVEVFHVLYPFGIFYCLVLGLGWNKYMNDYLIVNKVFLERGLEYEKYLLHSKNKTFIEEYRKDASGNLAFLSMKEL